MALEIYKFRSTKLNLILKLLIFVKIRKLYNNRYYLPQNYCFLIATTLFCFFDSLFHLFYPFYPLYSSYLFYLFYFFDIFHIMLFYSWDQEIQHHSINKLKSFQSSTLVLMMYPRHRYNLSSNSPLKNLLNNIQILIYYVISYQLAPVDLETLYLCY